MEKDILSNVLKPDSDQAEPTNELRASTAEPAEEAKVQEARASRGPTPVANTPEPEVERVRERSWNIRRASATTSRARGVSEEEKVFELEEGARRAFGDRLTD